jgi:undecaprenyl diphosphate synthase
VNGTERLHVGIIMDGNGRWAARQGLNRYRGHRAGSQAVRACIRAAPDFGVRVLTLYAFSANNWQRPAREVRVLMRLFERHLHDEMDECVQNGVRVQVIGRRDRLGARLCDAIEAAERTTRDGQRLLLRIAIDYSARDAILAAAERLPELGEIGTDDRHVAFGRLVASQSCEDHPVQDVDLIIRTGGEQRLSDFLLWEGAYAELYFTGVMWPDFGRRELQAAIAEFHGRERRFGSVTAASADVTAAAADVPAAPEGSGNGLAAAPSRLAPAPGSMSRPAVAAAGV